MKAEVIKNGTVEGPREAPICRAEMFTAANGEAQRTFMENPPAHTLQARCDLGGRK